MQRAREEERHRPPKRERLGMLPGVRLPHSSRELQLRELRRAAPQAFDKGRRTGRSSSVSKFDCVWFWNPSPMRSIDRKGQACRVLVRGAKNSVLVEFEDGFKVVTSRYAVRKRFK